MGSACQGSGDPKDAPVDTDTGVPGLPGCEGMDGAWQSLLATAEAELSEAEVPGAALAVICGGRLAYAQAWGPVTTSTRFQLASLTKMFTAAAVVSAAQEGWVDLQAPVENYVQDAPVQGPNGEPVSLHQLMSHTAGYPTMFPGGNSSSMDLEGYFGNNADQPLWSVPGTVYNYSNLGMALAGLVLEEALQQPFPDLVESRIFEPAGMGGAEMHADRVEAEGSYATGHSGSADNPLEVAPTDSYLPTGYYGPMGGAWGSVLDLAAWGEVLLAGGGEVLSAAAATSLSTPWTETRRVPMQHYGYGHFIDRIHGFDLLSHGGSVAGFLGNWMLVPEAGFGVFSLVNCDWYYPGNLGYEALDLFVGLEALDLTPYLWSQADWPAYVGSYLDPQVLGRVEVVQEGSSLVARFLDLGFESELTGSYEDVYRFDYEPSGFAVSGVFWRDETQGDVQYLVTPYGVAARQR
jgi:CubicO group peptidase (beta-lactamase class C family)